MPQDWMEPLTDFGKYLKGMRAAYEHVQKEGWSPEDFTQQLMQMAENNDMPIDKLNDLYSFLLHSFEIPFGGEDYFGPIAE